ncbi:multifunctional 2',3'-cyclic-nucleotide 2'-phosphodiesterase/5'-nucleotidase/3'-nucleotidase [Bacteroidia bacterium]|nr:multifunctional 2',3'-cyclic-nucleotide 2'-phosphodiesterase/5'-nucleotidase/3'-nucleotidase [Bacteroidia bacterium]
MIGVEKMVYICTPTFENTFVMEKINKMFVLLLSLGFWGSALAQVKDSDAREVVIMAVNDMHAAVEMFPNLGGVVDSVRAIHPDLLLFSAGDNRTGNPVNDRYSEPGWPMVDMMNILRFDASAVGNHEFDGDISGFRDLLQKSNFRYLCANMDLPDSMRLHVAPYRFFERNGIRIGVLGLIQTGPSNIPGTHPDHVKGVTFRKDIEVVKEYRWMREQCDVFILLSHCGYEEDLELAEVFPEADVIIGGHSHTILHDRIMRNGILITQTGNALKYVSELKLEVSGNRVTTKESKLIDLKATGQRNKVLETAVNHYTNESAKTLNTVLAKIETPFDNEIELGCLLADAHRSVTGADIALMNKGGIRFKTHPAGDFTMKDAFMLDPFANELVTYNLTGQEVEQAIASGWEIGEDPHVSGITYTITPEAPKKVKKLSVLINGKPINLKTTYRVALNSYLASASPFLKTKEQTSTGITSTDALIKYLQKQKSVSYQGANRISVSK